MDLRQSK